MDCPLSSVCGISQKRAECLLRLMMAEQRCLITVKRYYPSSMLVMAINT